MLLPNVAFANADSDFVSKIVDSFNQQTAKWEPILRNYATNLLKLTLTLEIAYLGIRSVLSREQIPDILKQFVMTLLMAGFFLACINNYSTWSWNIIHGLQKISTEMGAPSMDTQGPFQAGMDIAVKILSKIRPMSPGDAIGFLFAGLIVLVCFSLISARLVLIKCEAIISMSMALLLIGFGGSSFFKDYAINALKYVLSVGLKLMTMQLIIAVGIGFITQYSSMGEELGQIFVVIGACIVLFALVQTLPDVVAGILSGAHVGSGAGLGAAAGAVAGAAGGALAGGSMIATGASTVGSASKLADLAGKTGIGKLAHMGANLMSAKNESEERKSPTTSGLMKERLEAAKQEKE